jgi:hypothetical protein
MPQVFNCAINNTHSYAGSDRSGNGSNCMERNMLRYLFEGYADTIALATTLRPRPAKSAPANRQFRSALVFVDAPGGRAPRNRATESTAKRRSPSRWFAHWLTSR